MRHTFTLIVLAVAAPALAADVTFPKFKAQEIATDLTVGYAVIVADINEDGKPDIVVVDSKRVVWYENPTWKVHTVVAGKTKPDNVCIVAHDIDRDGHLDLVLGADWNPSNTKTGGTLQWLKRGKTLDEEWTVYPIGEEPTVHRVRVAEVDGKPAIILAPLQGREATAKGNWTDGRPVRIMAYPIPKDPTKGPWTPKVLSEELHVVHNIWPLQSRRSPDVILAASYEGVSMVSFSSDFKKWETVRIGSGNQSNPKGNRGASEIKSGELYPLRHPADSGGPYVATIEPWHGNQVVVYKPGDPQKELWDRYVIDDHLRWGHAVWCADLDGDKDDELIIGVRDNPAKGDKFTEKCGVRIYKATDGVGKKWERMLVEDGGVAVEDLTVADLNADGKPDIIAVGRATKNARIYWNQGK
jgi:Aldos-2-ulose dehydratase, beta-propeller domain/FG-GAP-like repeat